LGLKGLKEDEGVGRFQEVDFNMPLALPGLLARGFARFICGTDGRQPATWLGELDSQPLAFSAPLHRSTKEFPAAVRVCSVLAVGDKDLG